MKTSKAITTILLSVSSLLAFAQGKAPSPEMTQMLELSRPAAMHLVLKQLAGTWNFQDARLAFVKGTLTRTSKYDDRFFDVEITGGKLQLPVAGGMKEDNYRGYQLEGYDNARKALVTISVNNHIGSDIQQETGHYNEAKKQLIYEGESELLPGKKVKTQRVITMVDSTHYTEEYYEFKNGSFEKVRQINYSK